MLITNPLTSGKRTLILISYISLHNPVSTDTVFCSLKLFLRFSATDTSIFTGFSTKAA